MQQLSLGLSERDAALDALEQSRPAWVFRAKEAAVWHAKEYGYVTADTLRVLCPVPEGQDARIVGAVLKDKRLVKVSYTPTQRASSHARPIAVFRLREA